MKRILITLVISAGSVAGVAGATACDPVLIPPLCVVSDGHGGEIEVPCG